jgi:hypothetical protein
MRSIAAEEGCMSPALRVYIEVWAVFLKESKNPEHLGRYG